MASRNKKAPASREKFTADVIRAIEVLELHRVNRSDEELADAAWQKLQYDLPVVESAELAALVKRLRSSLQGKVSWPCYAMTLKLLENITGGAKRSTSFEPELPQHEQQLQQLLADSISASISSKTSHTSRDQQRTATATAKQQHSNALGQQTENSLQDLYQQLCAVVLLQYVAKVVSLSEQDAWQLLEDYQPEQQGSAKPDWQQAQQNQQQLQQLPGLQEPLSDEQLVAAALRASAGAGDGTAASADKAAATSTSTYEVTEAAVQDSDGSEYEPYEPLETAFLASNGSAHHHHQQQQERQPYSWEQLHRKLISIADHVQYQLIAFEPLWQQQAAAEHILQLLRALGVHSHSNELQPMVHAYAGLLVDRIAAAPADMGLLQQLWEALGLTTQGFASNGYDSRQPGQDPCRQSQGQGLPAEVVLGLTAAASVWQQVPGSSSRSRLWRLMYDDLLPLLEQCTEQLAYSSSSGSKAAKQQANGAAAANGLPGAQQQQQQSQGEKFAHVLLVSHIIELLVLGRPLSVDAAGQLTQLGVIRNMAQLFVQHGTEAAAEPLRRALLLCCCSSQQTAAWVLAVPAVSQQLQQPDFQLAGAAEAHGALWQLLTSRSNSSGASNHSATAAAAATSSSPGCQMMLDVLTLPADSIQDMQRLAALLQLMCDAQKAAGRHRLWDEAGVTAVKQLAGRVKDVQAAAVANDSAVVLHSNGKRSLCNVLPNGSEESAPAEAGHQQSPASSSDGMLPGGVDQAEDDSKGLHKMQRHDNAAAGESCERRQLQQLWLMCLKLVKELLTQGGKTD